MGKTAKEQALFMTEHWLTAHTTNPLSFNPITAKANFIPGSILAKLYSKGRRINVDGGMGPATIKALKGVEVDRVRAYRVKFYVDLITTKPEQEKFYYGWYKRSTEV